MKTATLVKKHRTLKEQEKDIFSEMDDLERELVERKTVIEVKIGNAIDELVFVPSNIEVTVGLEDGVYICLNNDDMRIVFRINETEIQHLSGIEPTLEELNFLNSVIHGIMDKEGFKMDTKENQ